MKVCFEVKYNALAYTIYCVTYRIHDMNCCVTIVHSQKFYRQIHGKHSQKSDDNCRFASSCKFTRYLAVFHIDMPRKEKKIDNFSPYECQICWINIFAITSQNNHNKTAHVFFLKSQPPLKISNERLVRKALGFFALLLLFFGYEKCFCILIFHILMLIQNK